MSRLPRSIFLFSITLLFFTLCFNTGCKNEVMIPESKFEQVWQNYHNNLFILGFQGQVKREEKIRLLRQISRKYLIPNKKMNSYISKKYPEYAKILFTEEAPEKKALK